MFLPVILLRSTYNKDFQEAWVPMYESVDTLSDCIQIAAGCLATLKIKPEVRDNPPVCAPSVRVYYYSI